MHFSNEINYDDEIILSEKDVREANLTFAEAVLFCDLIEISELAQINSNQI